MLDAKGRGVSHQRFSGHRLTSQTPVVMNPAGRSQLHGTGTRGFIVLRDLSSPSLASGPAGSRILTVRPPVPQLAGSSGLTSIPGNFPLGCGRRRAAPRAHGSLAPSGSTESLLPFPSRSNGCSTEPPWLGLAGAGHVLTPEPIPVAEVRQRSDWPGLGQGPPPTPGVMLAAHVPRGLRAGRTDLETQGLLS